MRNQVVGVLVLLACLCGCSRVHPVDPTANSSSLALLNETVRGKRVTIELRDGRKWTGDGVRVHADTTFWYELEAVTDRSAVATSDVAQISFRQRLGTAGRYAGKGVIGGVVGGSIGGLAVALNLEQVPILSGLLLGSGIGAVLGGGAAVITAFVLAPEERFIFPETGTPREDADR